MLFMVIERFRDNDMVPVYQRVRASGRALPEGLRYVDSWVEPGEPTGGNSPVFPRIRIA